MKDYLKRLGRILLHASFWIFVFSVRWDGRTLFSYGNEILVQNRIVKAIDESMGDIWYRVSETARITFKKLSEKDRDA